MKKLFGEINLTWKKVIIFAIIAGVYTACMAMLPIAKDTSFTDLAVTFEVWVLCGIFIIMNSKSSKDSALKCFVFFLISQPLIYLIQDAINHSNLFMTYYRYWFMWTIATIPMGFIGWYMKKDKWWGLIILAPMLLLVGNEYSGYFSKTMFSFPRHLLTTIFCFATLIIYPIAIFKNKKIKLVGSIISITIILVASIMTLVNPSVYDTVLLSSGEKYSIEFDENYKVYLKDSSFGKIYIRYEEGLEDYVINAEFTKAGKTEFVIESPDGEKDVFEIDIKRDTYNLKKISRHEKSDSFVENDIIIENTFTENGENIAIENNLEESEEAMMLNINVIINNKTYKVKLEDNETVKKFIAILPQKFDMKELNGNEKYVYLDQAFPTNSYHPNHIEAGDIMLYGDDCLVVFYKSFDTSYSYTKIGHIEDLENLDNKDITIRFEK